MEKTYDFGLVGLGVMGRNFILNVADNGFTAFGNDVDKEKVDALIFEGGNQEIVNASIDVSVFKRFD
jgi:6-phosphogluconate dehydrogenase